MSKQSSGVHIVSVEIYSISTVHYLRMVVQGCMFSVCCSGCKVNAGSPHCNTTRSVVRGECFPLWHQSARPAASWSQEQIWWICCTHNVDDWSAGICYSQSCLSVDTVTILSQLQSCLIFLIVIGNEVYFRTLKKWYCYPSTPLPLKNQGFSAYNSPPCTGWACLFGIMCSHFQLCPFQSLSVWLHIL